MYKILASTLFLGKEVIYMPSCHSTNDLATDYVRKGDKKEGIIFITDNQTKGKGQRGNTWQSEQNKNLTFSIYLKPDRLPIAKQFYLNMVASLAVAQTIRYYLPESNVKVKWPNDVLVANKKISGILIENSLSGTAINSAVIGIGLNVNQKAFGPTRASSLMLESSKEFFLPSVLERLVNALEANYLLLKSGQFEQLKNEYLAMLYGYQRKVRLRAEHEFDGSIVDLEENGLLHVLSDHQRYVFDFKEVSFLLS